MTAAGRVERVVGGPPLALTLAGLAVPAQLPNVDQPGRLEGTHGPVTVRRWRSDPDSRPEPATCSVTVSARALAAAGYVGPPQLGDQLVVELSDQALEVFGLAGAVQRPGNILGIRNDLGTGHASVTGPDADGWYTATKGTTGGMTSLVRHQATAMTLGDVYTWAVDVLNPSATAHTYRVDLGDVVTAQLVVQPGQTARIAATGPAPLGEYADVQTLDNTTYKFRRPRLEAGPVAHAWAWSPRFVGRLTDVEAIPETVGGGPALYKLTAAGPSARLGRLTIGEPPWPVELDGERVERVLAAAAAQAADLVVGDVDPGTVSVFARDVDAQGAQSLVDELAVSGGGELVELRDGSLEFHDAEHRRNAPSLVELSAGEVLAPASWKSTLAGLVNDLTLSYGDPAVDVQLVDETAAAGPLGRLAAKLSTQLAAAGDATVRVTDLLGRRSRQRWRIEQLPIDLVATVTPAKAGQLLASSFGDLVDVVGFPSAGPFAVAALWIEGQTETITARSWRLDLAVSEYGLTAPAPRWVDVVDDELAIADVPDDVSILAATGWWPDSGRQSAGRFVDVPAGLDIRDAPDAELLGSTSY